MINLAVTRAYRLAMRSGDPVAIAGPRFCRPVRSGRGVFAENYADQNERDYAAPEHAAEAGRIETESG